MTGPLLRRSKRPAFTGALLDWWRSCRRPPLFAWLTVFSFSRRRIRWPPERVRARASDPARAADGVEPRDLARGSGSRCGAHIFGVGQVLNQHRNMSSGLGSAADLDSTDGAALITPFPSIRGRHGR